MSGPGVVTTALRELRALNQRLRSAGVRGLWRRSFAAGIGWAAILVTAGLLTGMDVSQFVPIALVQGVVIGGLVFVAGMPPVAQEPAPGGGGDGDVEAPPHLDPEVWGRMFEPRSRDVLSTIDSGADAEAEAPVQGCSVPLQVSVAPLVPV